MTIKNLRTSAAALCACLLLSCLTSPLQAAISKTSKRVLRPRSAVSAVVSDMTAAALSTSSIRWSWSTGTYTGIDGFYLYSSSTATKIALSSSTAFYIDSGLGADQSYTRWLTAYQGATEGSDSHHIQKYTYAIPPAQIAISTDAPVAAPTTNSFALPWARRTDNVISTSAYAEIPPDYWFPNPVHASAYAIECSTDGGLTYVRNRTFFVPWETFPVMSNRHYMIRMAAVNGDDEVTPGVYSATRTFTTPPLTPADFTAVAVSSYTIQWRWDKDMFAGTEIAGFKVYRSSIAEDGTIPEPGDFGEVIATLGAGVSDWTEVYRDTPTLPSADSRHTRWLKAYGFLESERSQFHQKYTYAVAPGTTTAEWRDPLPYWAVHVWENSLSLNWPTFGVSTDVFSAEWRPGVASNYVIDRSTTGGFTVAVTSTIVGQPVQAVTGLTENTKYDLRIGAINGDGEQTPANGPNPFAYSQLYRVMTRPGTPSDYACAPWTDTAVHCTWTPGAYTHPEYLTGYFLRGVSYHPDGSDYWTPSYPLPGVASSEYNLDYLLTNSTVTAYITVGQTDPDWVAGNPHFDASPQEAEYYYNNFGSYSLSSNGYTYATPPNDVAFATIAPHGLGMWWLEPEVPATQYRVERSTTLGPAGPWVFVASVTGNSYHDSGVDISTAGLAVYTTYTYRIGAINLLGFQTLDLSTHTAGHRKDYSFAESTMTKHGAPSLFALATGTNSIRWFWTESYSGVTAYNLYTSTDGLIAPGLGAGVFLYNEVALSSANALYTRRVRSVTAYDGLGDYDEVPAYTLANAPASVAITSTGSYTMTLGWPATEASRYKVDRSTDRVNWTPRRDWSDVHVSTWFNDSGLRYATTYYYAVSAYNGDGVVALSSAITAAVTAVLPGIYTPVSAAALPLDITAPLQGGGSITVTLPAGTPDGFFWLSTAAAASPSDVSKNAIDDANARLTEASMVPGNIVELHLFDQFGNVSTAALPSPARIAITYPDATDDGIVDGSLVRTPTLRLYNLDTDALVWNRVQNSVLNSGAKTVSADLPHFSFYALAGDDFASTFMGVALSTVSLQWKWPTVNGVDGYYLYSSSTATKITVSSNTSAYIDSGLSPNRPYTRWVAPFTGAAEGTASSRVTKYTHALPPASFALSSVTAVSAYLEWHYSTATAYAVEGSTNGGVSYYRIRDAFVPWQTVPLMSNKAYRLRIGAINGDDELSPGYYTTVQLATTPPLNMTMTGAAISSHTIQWSWDISAVADTGVTAYNIYKSTTSESAGPAAGETGTVVQTLGVNTTYWIETFANTGSPLANSQHARWIKAAGILESEGRAVYTRYTYAIAPSTCAPTFPDFQNVFSNSVNLSWTASGASKYVIEYATATLAQSSASFSVGLTSAVVPGPSSVAGLQGNTKHDFRIGAINGDDLMTPDNALNPEAYSARYKVITRPPPTDVSAAAVTDTAIKWSWSTGTFTNMDYIIGYIIGIGSTTPELGNFVLPIDYILGTNTTNYTLDYLITNSVHERYICPDQSTATYNYASFNGLCVAATGATFATPPNDVSFDTITAHTVGLWWNEPEIPATQYSVWRATSTGEDGPWVFLSSVAGNHYLDTGLDISASGLTTSTTYAYRIGAINTLGIQTLGLADATGGNRRDYSFVESTMTVQRSPTLFAAATGSSTINWSWTNDVPAVLSYNLYTSTNGILARNLSAATTFWVEVNLSSANTVYTRRIRSVTTAGESDFSEASAVTFAAAPAALAASATDVHYVTLGWTGNGGTRYRLDRSEDLVTWTTVRAWADALSVAAYTDTSLHAAATYYYAVRAYNQDGVLTVSSATSAAIRTLDLPANVTQVFSTAAASLAINAPLPGVGTLAVTLPAGAVAADNYVQVSTSAGTVPAEVTKANLDAATAKLPANTLVPGTIVELRRWDMYGALATAGFATPARVSFTYTDATNDGVVDGTAIAEDTLRVFLLDPVTLVWYPQRNSVTDTTANTVYLDTSHFSIYALGSQASAVGELGTVFAYPNPYKPGSAGAFGQSSFGEGIVFESMPAGAKVKIYSLAAGLVRELADDDGDGRCLWDARNADGSRAASGVYIYVVSSGGSKKTGRVAIIK